MGSKAVIYVDVICLIIKFNIYMKIIYVSIFFTI